MMTMRYDVEADFVLLRTCNYRCSYCFIPTRLLASKLPDTASNEEWEQGFHATGKTWLIHITGGEPTVYPGFVDLCRRLQTRHYLSINSNLSHRCVDEFAASIDPCRVHFINAALHLEERQKKSELDTFIERVLRLRAAGFSVLVSQVMSPEMLATYRAISGHLATRGLSLIPKVLRGTYRGVQYPAAYTATEKALFREYLAEARHSYADLLAHMGETPTIDMFSDHFLDGVPDYRGQLCGSGHNFVKIDSSGDVLRCGSNQLLGNLLRRDVRLLAQPRPCDTHYCPYFCEKYTSPQFRGTQRLIEIGTR